MVRRSPGDSSAGVPCFAMADRDPDAWQTSAAGPFLTLERERGSVEVWALGDDRFVVLAPELEREVDGFEEAREAAHELAGRLAQLPREEADKNRGATACPHAARLRGERRRRVSHKDASER